MTDATENSARLDATNDANPLSQEAQHRVEANMDCARELKDQRELDKQAKAGAWAMYPVTGTMVFAPRRS